MGFDNFSFKLMGGYQTYQIEDVASIINPGQTDDVDVNSYMIGAMGTFNIGPGYIRAALSYDENGSRAGWLGNTFQAAFDGDDDTIDSNLFQAALVGGFKMSDMLSFEGGFGYVQTESDANNTDEFNPWAAYIQAVVFMAPGVAVVPEIGYFDNDSGDIAGVKTDFGSSWYAGAKWQIDF
jgi:hypothetical protein